MKSACAPVDAQYFYGSLGRVYTECGKWNTNALARIRQLRPALTILASSEGYSLQSAEWRKGISTVVASLAESSQKVLILQDTPRPNFDVPTCLARHQWRSAVLPSEPCEFGLSATSNVHEHMRLAGRPYINVVTADLSPMICNESVCRSEQKNVIIYRDSNHLTASFAKHLESALEEHIESALAGKEEGRPYAAGAPRTPADLVPRQETNFVRSR